MLSILSKYINNTEFSKSDPIFHYRERIFNIIAITLIISGFFALIVGVYASIRFDEYMIAIVDILAYAILLFLFFNRSIPLIIKKIYIISLPFLLGIFFMINIGPEGPGFAYFVGFNILAAILLGTRATYYSLSITTIVLFGFTAIIHYKLFPDYPISNFSALGYFAAGINMIFIGSISSLPIAFLVKHLEQQIIDQEKMQQQAEQNLIEISAAKLKAEESDKLKSSFLANMSHEIRTPLNAINGFSQILIDVDNLDEADRNKYLKTINDSGNYLLNVIENILDISLIESKQLKYYIKPFSIHEFFSDIQRLYSADIISNHNVDINFKACCTESHIILSSDNDRLKQVIVNLINNALKFTMQGNIDVGFNLLENSIEFYVKDSGAGIDEKIIHSIFNRFVKGEDHYGENKKGTGLGLPISKEIIKALGGKIWVESELNKGSCFYFTIPYEQ